MSALNPIINRLNRPFWDGAARGELWLPHCAVTDRAFWPPSPISPFADAAGVAWRPREPVGVVRAMVAYRRVFHPALAALTPFGIALVELDAGPRLQAHVVDPDGEQAPRAGQRVRLRFGAILPDGPPIPIVETLEN